MKTLRVMGDPGVVQRGDVFLEAGDGIGILQQENRIRISATGGAAGASSWDAITGKPSVFTPATHAHATSDVTGLAAELATKADASALAAKADTLALTAGLASKADASALTGKADAAATTTALAGKAPNASYRTILDSSGSHAAARAAGTYALAQGDPLALTGVGTLYPWNTIYLDPADYPAVDTLTAKLRIRAQLYTNDVAPGGTYTFGLYPITRPATSGGAGLCIYTIGTVVAGSNGASLATLVADSMRNAVSADFAVPATGHYVLGVLTSAVVAASAHVHVSAQLQMRNA